MKKTQEARGILGKTIDRVIVADEKTRPNIEITLKDGVITNRIFYLIIPSTYLIVPLISGVL
jgi:hypothetical protein